MSEIISAEKLLGAAALGEKVVELEGVGAVRVRSLSRAAVLQFNDLPGTVAKERHLIKHGLVEPKLTETQIARWQESADANTIGRLTEAIADVSGLRDGADKEAAKSAR